MKNNNMDDIALSEVVDTLLRAIMDFQDEVLSRLNGLTSQIAE